MQLFNTQTLGHRQSMVVTAQLQQAIVLLQMGNNDLQSFIESQAEENPFLELGVPAAALRPLPSLPSSQRSHAASDDDWDRMANLADDQGVSLYSHAAREIERLHLAAPDRAVADVFLEALEPSGWLGQPVAAVAAQAGVSEQDAEAVLKQLHAIEPAGLFARNLAECLRLQAVDQGIMTPVFAAVLNNLPKLAAADLAGLARTCRCDMDELRAVLRQLRSLNPKPGAIFDTAPMPQRAPDLIVTRGNEGWQIDLNRSTLPSVVIRDDEAARIGKASREPGTYVQERLSVARWLARAVEHRNMTTLKVGAEVIRRQKDFLDHGPSHLRPMVLREVAEAIGVHESTVSRVTSGLMMATPQGTFPMKYFFTAALSRNEGEDPGSAAAVRHRIKQLIAAEQANSPLSDDQLARMISDEGTNLARRTVAKYREQLRIGSSTERRRQALVSGMK